MYSTVYLFDKSVEGTSLSPTPSSNWDMVENLIEDSSILLSEYLNRDLEAADYVERCTVLGDTLYVENYPINYIDYIGLGSIACMSVQIDATTIRQANINTTADKANLKVLDIGGSSTEYDFSFDTYATFTQLASAMNNISGITADVLEDDLTAFISIGSITLSVLRGQGVTGYIHKLGGLASNYYAFADTNMIDIHAIDNYMCQIKYNAGFYTPEDDADHTSLVVAGTIPDIITHAVNRATRYMLENINSKIDSGIFKSERLGDYSYTLSDDIRDEIKSIFDGVYGLTRLKRKNLMGRI